MNFKMSFNEKFVLQSQVMWNWEYLIVALFSMLDESLKKKKMEWLQVIGVTK